MSVSHRLRTERFDIYRNLVLRTARKEESIEVTDESDYPFDTNYELFAAGLTLGFLRDEQREESEGDYSQGFIQVDRIGGSSDNEYRQGIEFVYRLIQLDYADEDIEESDIWKEALRYADAGVEHINQDIDRKGTFDFLGFLGEAEGEWQNQLKEIIDYPQEEEA
jgi:hypothetical protein